MWPGQQDDEPSAVVDRGVKGRSFQHTTDVVVSANGQRLGYIAALPDSRSQVVVDNGKESVPYDECNAISVSSDGSILSFFAKSSQGNLLVVNGQEFGPFYSIHNLTYSGWETLGLQSGGNRLKRIGPIFESMARPIRWPKGARL
jgi:hypothetical protein